MKKGIIKGVQKIGDEKSYIPDETLVTFIQNWLHIHKKKERLTKDGEELSSKDKKKLRESDRMKVYILDNLVFPAMSNLTYFFEAMSASTKLSNAFEDELKEILDPRKSKSASQLSDGMRMSSIQFRRNNMSRLVEAMLDIPMKNYTVGKPVGDFRIGLMYQIFNIIGDKMDRLISHEYSMNQIWKSFWEDYQRMQGWLALLVRTSEDEPKEYDRKLGFEPIWNSNKTPNGGWDF